MLLNMSSLMLSHHGALIFLGVLFLSSLLCRLTPRGSDPCITPVLSLPSSLPLLPTLEMVSSVPEVEGMLLVNLHP